MGNSNSEEIDDILLQHDPEDIEGFQKILITHNNNKSELFNVWKISRCFYILLHADESTHDLGVTQSMIVSKYIELHEFIHNQCNLHPDDEYYQKLRTIIDINNSDLTSISVGV